MEQLTDIRISQGWLTGVRRVPSPNCGPRPPGTVISLLVIHNISLPPGEFGTGCIQEFFTNTLAPHRHPYFSSISELCVSSHLLIERTGELTQFVSFAERAWHAGQSSFDGVENCNDFSIGIELEGTDELPYTDRQYQVLGQLGRLLLNAYPALNSRRIVGHCDIAPGRKTDPGPAFDWQRFSAEITKAEEGVKQ